MDRQIPKEEIMRKKRAMWIKVGAGVLSFFIIIYVLSLLVERLT